MERERVGAGRIRNGAEAGGGAGTRGEGNPAPATQSVDRENTSTKYLVVRKGGKGCHTQENI